MENKNTLSVAYSGDTNVAPIKYKAEHHSRKSIPLLLTILLVLGLFGAGAAWLVFGNNNNPPDQQVASLGQFDDLRIDLTDITPSSFTDSNELSVLGQLNVYGGFALTPGPLPSNPKTGQIYYDQATNTLNYYNGASFVVLDEDQELQAGAGLASADNVLTNTGVLSIQGLTGNLTLTAGDGITINGTTISANVTTAGVQSLTSGSPNLNIVSDGNGNLTISSVGGGTGNVQTAGGTAGRLAVFTGADTIANSVITESGGAISVGGNLSVTGAASISGNLAVGGSLTLGSPLSVANGGTGSVSLGANGVLVGNAANPVSSIVAGGPGLCFVSTAGTPTWANCTSPTNAVQSLNGLTGNLTIANATGLVDTITINDASTATKGIAQFNATNFNVVGGNVNTTQNISSASSPTFNGMALTGNLTVQGNATLSSLNCTTFDNGGVLTTNGSGQIVCGDDDSSTGGVSSLNGLTGALNIQGTAGQITATPSGSDVTLALHANVAMYNAVTANFTGTLQQGGNNVCTTAGNCSIGGAAGGDLTGTYPNPTIASLQGSTLNIVTPTAGQVLIYNDTDDEWQNVSISSDIAISETGVATIQLNSVALGADTTGNYVLDLSAGTGIDISGTLGEGWTPTITLEDTLVTPGSYGSGSNVATFTVDQQGRLTAAGNTAIAINGNQITTGVINDARLSSNVTLQGNTFNGSDQLVQLNSAGQLPTLSGINLTDLNATQLTSGTVPNARLSGSYTGITGVGTIGAGTWQGNVVAVSYGGTGASTTQGAINNLAGLSNEGDLLYFDGADSTALARGTTGQCLVSTATSVQWGSCLSAGGISSLGGQTGATQTFSNDTNVTVTSNANNHALGWTGTLAVSRGGTGASTLNDLITLGAHTTGNYVVNATGSNGVTVTGSASEGWTPNVELTGQALALHNLGTNGLIVRTGAGTVAARSITAGGGLAVTNSDGVSGNPTVALDHWTATLGSNPNLGVNTVGYTSGGPLFEGSTNDNNELLLTVADPTADRTITLPDATGTVITTGNLTDITATGTVASGVWQGTVVGVSYGGTGASTAQGAINNLAGLTTQGDLLYHDGANATRLARGSTDQCLVSTATSIEWASCTAGGGISGSGASGQVAFFNDTGSITSDTDLQFDGTTLTANTLSVTNNGTIGGTLAVQGANITVGGGGQLGTLVLNDGNGQTTTVQAGNSTGNLTFILPTNTGSASQCLKQSGTGNQLVWDDCEGGTGGVSGVTTVNSLDGALTVQGTTNNIVVTDDGGSTITINVGTDVTLQGNTFNGASQLVQLNSSSELPAVSGVNLTNLNASNLASGTVPSARVSGSYTGITGVGTISTGIWQGSAIADTYVANDLTISSSGSVDWLALTNYPVGCSMGEAVTAIGDTLTCAAFAPASGSGNYINNGVSLQTAANFNIQSGDISDVTANYQVLTSQTADVIRVRDATDTSTVFAVDPDGDVTATSFSGNGSGLTALNGSNISSGTVANARLVNSGALTVTAGTGLTGGGSVALGSSTTIDLEDTTVTLGSYGSASSVATFTVDQQGRLTAAGSTSIAIAASQVTSGTLGVARGGTGAGTFNVNGVLFGNGTSALQATTAGTGGQVLIANASGVPTFVTFSDDIAVSDTGSVTIQPNAVALGADTTGNYIDNITSGNGGIAIGGSAGEGWEPSITLTLQANKGLEVDVNGLSLIDCSDGEILKYNGTNQWACAADGAGAGVTAIGALDSQSPSANGAVISSNTLYLQSASNTDPGLVNTSAQTFAGDKTFNGQVVAAGGINLGTQTLQGTSAVIDFDNFDVSSAGVLTLGTDVQLSRGAANRLDLATGDSLNLVSGAIQQNGTTRLTSGGLLQAADGSAASPAFGFSGDTDNDTGMYRIGEDVIGFSTDGGERLRITTADTQITGDLSSTGNLSLQGATGITLSGAGADLIFANGERITNDTDGTINLQSNSGAVSLLLTGTAASITNSAGNLTIDSAGSLIVQDATTIAGTLTVNTITPSGAMTIGSTGEDLTLQGNAVTTLSATDSGNTTTLAFTTPTDDITLLFPTLAAGSYDICTSAGNCAGAGVTLQTAYDNSSTPEIEVDSGNGAVTIRDALTPIGANLLEVQNNDASTTFFAVTANGIQTTGSIASSGNINTSAGTIQTAGTNRIDNAGNLVNIGNLTAAGAITITSTGGGSDITLSSADQIILNGGGTIELLDATNITGNLAVTGTYNTNTFNGNTLTFGTAGTASISSAASQALTLTANASSTWSTSSGDLSLQAAGILNLGTGGGSTINIGTNNAAHTIGIGNTGATGTQAITIGGSGNTSNTLVLEAGTGSGSIQIGNGATAHGIQIGTDATGDNDIAIGGTNSGSTVVIQAGTAAGAITIGNNAAASGIQIGNNSGGDKDIIIGSANTGSTLTLEAGTAAGAILIGNGNTAHGIQIGTGAAVQTISIGSTNSTSALTLQAGTGGLSIQTQGGTLGIGNNAVAQTLVIGNGTGTTGVSVLCGTGTCGFGNNATDHSTVLGSTTGTSATTVQAGTGGLSLTSGANITLGASDTTGTLLILDTKTDINDPTGVNGGMYYNSSYGRFRCYQNNVWVDCIGTSTAEYLRAVMSAQQTTNLTAGDHMKLDTVQASAGGSVALDTATYPALGRLTLAAGKTYRLSGVVSGAGFSGSDCWAIFQWYNVTQSAYVGNAMTLYSTIYSGNEAPGGLAEGVITPSSNATVEIRIRQIAGGCTITAMDVPGQGRSTYAHVEVLEGGGSGGASAAEFMRADLVTPQTATTGPGGTTQVTSGHHIDFDTVTNSSGSSITLDTTTTYTTSSGVASSGRFTLAAGKTYRLTAQVPWANFSGPDSEVTYRWYDATAGAYITGGTGGSVRGATVTTGDHGTRGTAEAIFSPSVTTLVEVRIPFQSGTTEIGHPSAGPALFPNAYIEVLSDGTKIAQFQGATASSDGQAGFIPGPVAGQQGSLLVGDGSWSSGLTFLNTTADRGLQLDSTEDAFLVLNGDSDNDGSEVGAGYIKMTMDGGTTAALLGGVQAASTDPEGNAYTGVSANAFLFGTISNSTLQFGTNDVVRLTISNTGNITVGQSDTTGSLLILDTKTDSGDPSGTEGGMYYNSNTDRFRCYQASAWRDCVSAVTTNVLSNAFAGVTNLTSTTYVNMPATSSLAFTKKAASTKLIVDINVTAYSNSASLILDMAVRVDSTDYNCGKYVFNTINEHQQLTCMVAITGLSAGNKTVQGRWKVSGFTATTDATDWISMKVQETD